MFLVALGMWCRRSQTCQVQVDEVDVEQTADADAPGEAADAADADEDEHTEDRTWEETDQTMAD